MKYVTLSLLLTLFLSTGSFTSYAKKDSTYKSFTYIRVGLDLSKPFMSIFNASHKSFECQADINLKKTINFATEFGMGNAIVNNDYIKYKSRNSFIRLGVDQTFFNKEFKGDMDNAFVGIRYAMGFVNRQDASYTINDPVWGTSNGVVSGNRFLAHWIELTGGFRLEVKKNIFLGWNMRLKTIVNPKKFQSLPPAYMAGYGRGDKNSNVDFNFYLLYGFGKKN